MEPVQSRKLVWDLLDRVRVVVLAEQYTAGEILKVAKDAQKCLKAGFYKPRGKNFVYRWYKVKVEEVSAKGLRAVEDSRKGNTGTSGKFTREEQERVAAQYVVAQDSKGASLTVFAHATADMLECSAKTVKRTIKKHTKRDKQVTVPNTLTAKHVDERLKFCERALESGRKLKDGSWFIKNWCKNTVFEDEFGFQPGASVKLRKVLLGAKTKAVEALTQETDPLAPLVERIKRQKYEQAVLNSDSDTEEVFKEYFEAQGVSANNSTRELCTVFHNGHAQDPTKPAYDFLKQPCDQNVVRKRVWLQTNKKKQSPTMQLGVVFSWWCKGPIIEFFDRRQDKRVKKRVRLIVDTSKKIGCKYWCEKAEVSVKETFRTLQARNEEKTKKRRYKLQFDGARSHSGKFTQNKLKNEWRISLLHQPARSPDVQPAELVIAELKKRAYAILHRKYSLAEINKTTGAEAVKEAWEQLPLKFIRKCILHVKKQCALIVENSGNYSRTILRNDPPSDSD